MIESIMYCGIGFLLAALIGVAVFPLVHGRAVRLTKRRLQDAIPTSVMQVQADKDLIRAEFATSTRRLEMSVEQLKNKTTSQLVELSRKNDAINKLKIEHHEKYLEIMALRTEVDALRANRTEANGVKDRHQDGGAPMYSFSRSPLNEQHRKGDVVSLITESPTAEVAKVLLDPWQTRTSKNQCHEGDAISLAPSLAPRRSPTTEGNQLGGLARGIGGTGGASDQSLEMAPKRSDLFAGLRAVSPSSHRPLGFEDHQLLSDKPSAGTARFRSLAPFFIAVLVGIGGTFVWQSHSNEAKAMIRSWAFSLRSLLSAGTTRSPPNVRLADAQTSSTPSGQASRDAAPPQSVTQRPAPPAAATSPEAAQQLQAMARDLAVVRRSVQQLADKQEQMAQNIATLQTDEQDVGQKSSSLPPQTRAKLTPWPETRPTTIPGWTLRQVTNGTAILEGPNGIWRAARGDTVPGVGRVDSIVHWGNLWIVATSRGLISSP